jgi:putative transposase
VKEAIHGLSDAEADEPCGAKRHERNPEWLDTRVGYHGQTLQPQAGAATLKMPRLRSAPFETEIIERRRLGGADESSCIWCDSKNRNKNNRK